MPRKSTEIKLFCCLENQQNHAEKKKLNLQPWKWDEISWISSYKNEQILVDFLGIKMSRIKLIIRRNSVDFHGQEKELIKLKVHPWRMWKNPNFSFIERLNIKYLNLMNNTNE